MINNKEKESENQHKNKQNKGEVNDIELFSTVLKFHGDKDDYCCCCCCC